MGLPASKLVQLTIGLQVSAASRAAFGVPLIVDTDNVQLALASVPVVSTVASLDELEALGFEVWHKAHKMLSSLFAQRPRPPVVKIASIFGGTINSANLSSIESVDPIWWAFLITSRTSADLQAAATWCDTVATGKHVFVGETQDAAAFTVAPSVLSILKTAGRTRTTVFARKARPQVQTLTVSAAFMALNSITLKVNGVSIGPIVYAVSSDATMLALANAITAAGGAALCVAAVTPVGAPLDDEREIVITSINPLVQVELTDYACSLGVSQNTAQIATVDPGAIPCDAAAVGAVVPLGAGKATWFGKTLRGLEVDALSSNEVAAVEAQNGNVYVEIGGKAMTYNGTCSANAAPGVPLFVDLVAGIDAFEADLQTALIDVLTANAKLPFNDKGIAAVVGAINGVAQRYVGDFLEPYQFGDAFNFPSIADVPPGDKSTRVLNGISAQFDAVGAIQKLGGITVNVQA